MTIVAAIAVVLSLAAPQDAPPRYESSLHGFRLDVPDGWNARELSPTDGGSPTVSIAPRGSLGVPSFAVYVVNELTGDDVEKTRDAVAKKFAGKGAKGVERGDGEVSGVPAKLVGFRIAQPSIGEVLVRCSYFAAHERMFCLQLTNVVDDGENARKLEHMLASFELFEPAAPDPARVALERLADRCWEAVPWTKSWDEAAARAKADKKLVLVAFQNYAALGIASTLHTGVFLDPDFRDLVRERFVPLRLGPKDDAPFRAPEKYGVSEHAWGTAFLFVTADGDVVRETAVMNASYLHDIASSVVAAPAGGGEPEALDARERAAALRRERKGDAALDVLREAKRALSGGPDADLDCDEAVVLMRMGRFADAEERFRALAREHESSERAPEALFYLGAFEALRTSLETDPPSWLALVEKHADSLWAAKAAANLLKQGAFAHGLERLDWPEAALIDCARMPAVAPVARAKARDVERGCVEYLLATQKDDGTWWAPIDDFHVSQDLYSPAITAICAGSLVPEASDARARQAVERTLAWVLGRHRSGALAEGTALEATYSIWRRTYALWLVARCREARIGDAQELARAMDELTASVCANQHAGGGWPYVYFPGDPDGSTFDPSASFLTAAVVNALLDARTAGAKVPQAPLDRALAFLSRMRDDDGTFRYMPGVAGAEVDGSHPEAGGRGPACAITLLRGGKGGDDLVRDSLDLYLRHRPGFAGTWRKELCHTGAQAQGAHYLLFNHSFACAATRELPPNRRARYRDELLDDLLAQRLADGSFADLPALGRPYGTAMALMSLRALRGD